MFLDTNSIASKGFPGLDEDIEQVVLFFEFSNVYSWTPWCKSQDRHALSLMQKGGTGAVFRVKRLLKLFRAKRLFPVQLNISPLKEGTFLVRMSQTNDDQYSISVV